MTRSTYLERRWPDTPVFQDVAHRWCEDQSRLLLGLVWRGYDLLCAKDFQEVPMRADDEAKEESLNHLLAVRIDECKSGDEPFSVSHQPPEQAARKRGRARSPQPDIGFALYDYPGSIWPIEAKVLHHDRDVRAYLAEIRGNFLTGRYATFSREGAMVGYLLDGATETFLGNIAGQIAERLLPHPHFQDRPHRVSEHIRSKLPDANAPTAFSCHHLVMHVAAV